MSSHYVPHTKIADPGLPHQRPGRPARRAHDREPHPPEQLRRPAHRPRPAHRLHARRPLSRADPPAPGSQGLDFSRVITFNLDEYYPDAAGRPAQLPPLDAARRSSTTSTFRRRTSTFPTAPSRSDDVEDYCLRYEQKIRRAGGIDLQILGIGRTGHIGFNEPGSHPPQPDAHGHARPGDAPRRRQQLLRRGERAAPGPHHGRRHHPRRQQDRADGLRRAQGPHRAARRRGADQRRRRRQLPAAAHRRHLPARPGRRRRAGRHRPALDGRPGATGRRP